jgi:hypothetical protein
MARPRVKNQKSRGTQNSNSHTPGRDARQWRVAVSAAAASIIIAAAIVRIWAACDELWMDEIWTLLAPVTFANSLRDIFTSHHDNNHYLMTLWMYLLGPWQRFWIVYRIPSIAAGIGTVALAGQIARRWGQAASITALLLTSASYVLIVYASEARGYAMSGFFALAAFLVLDRYLATKSMWANLLFILSTVLGTLAHLTFVEFYLAAIVWSCIVCWKVSPTWKLAALHLARLHAVPLLLLVLLYFIDVRYLIVGGGREEKLRHVLARTLALTVGNFAEGPAWILATALLGAGIATAAIVMLWRQRSDLCVFFAIATVVAPALILVIRRPTQLYERYFYLNVLFLLVLCSYAAGRLWRLGALGRSTVALALLLYSCGNARLTYDFLRVGRGHFRDALDHMVSHSTRPDITIATNGKVTHNAVYTLFYRRYRPEHDRIKLVNVTRETIAPEWVLFNSQESEFRPPQEVFPFDNRQAYVLEGVFPFAGLSGMHFAVYHRLSDVAGASPRKKP